MNEIILAGIIFLMFLGIVVMPIVVLSYALYLEIKKAELERK